MEFIFKIEPRDVNEALINEYWFLPMQKVLEQFERNNVWKLVPKPSSKITI